MRSLVAAVLLVAASALPAAGAPVTVGYESPESAHYDPTTSTWYVTNFGGYLFGSPPAEGYISMISPDGLTPEPIIGGLDQPFGLTVQGDTMYVNDSDGVVVIDVPSRSITGTIPVPDASLNDVAVDPATGLVYSSDSTANRIFEIDPETHEVTVVSDGDLDGPNGLLVEDGRLVVATLGFNGPDRGGVHALDLATGELSTIAVGVGTLDGIEADGDGYLVTDYIGRLVRVGRDGSQETVAVVPPSAADLAFDPATRTVAVPHTLLNLVTFTEV